MLKFNKNKSQCLLVVVADELEVIVLEITGAFVDAKRLEVGVFIPVEDV